MNTPDPEDTTLLYLHKINTSSTSSSSTSNSTEPSSSSSSSSCSSSSTVTTPPVEIFVPLLQTSSMLREYVAHALDIPKYFNSSFYIYLFVLTFIRENVAMAKYAVTNKIPSWKIIFGDEEDHSPSTSSSSLTSEVGPKEVGLNGGQVLLPPVLGPHSLEVARRGRHSLKRANAGHSNRVIVKDGGKFIQNLFKIYLFI